MIKLRWKVIAAAAAVIFTPLGVTAAAASSHAPHRVSFSCVRNVYIHTSNGHYLDVKGSGGSQSPVITWYYNGAANQHWCLEPASQGGYYLHPDHNVAGLCLDVPFSQPAQGKLIWVFTCNGSEAQRWAVNINGSSTTIRPELDTALGLQDSGLGYQTYLNNGGGSTWYFR
jgi:Ricin-type beta-trefoil lectin domain